MEDSMKKRLCILIIMFLFMTNVATVFTVVWNKRRGHRHEGKTEERHKRRNRMIMEELNLSAEQKKKFLVIDSLIEQQKEITAEKIKINKVMFSKQLSIENNDKKLDSLSSQISELTKDYYYLRNREFIQISKMCDKEQKKRLEEFFEKNEVHRNERAHK